MKIGVPRPYENANELYPVWRLLLSRISQTAEWVSETEYTGTYNLRPFEAVLAGKVDVIIFPWLMTDLRLAQVNFSLPLGLAELTLRITSEDAGYAEPNMLSLLLPHSILSVFTPSLWQVLAMLFVGMLLASKLLIMSEDYSSHLRQRFGSWRWFSHFTLQDTASSAGQKVGGLSKASRLFLLLTGLLTLHSLTLYQGGLLAQLVKDPRLEHETHQGAR